MSMLEYAQGSFLMKQWQPIDFILRAHHVTKY